MDIKPEQLKLADDGRVLYQKDPTNPLPGAPVGVLRKGRKALAPDFEITDESFPGTKEHLGAGIQGYIQEILGALTGLEDTDELPAPVRGICFQIHEAMGIVPRENLEDLIAMLDPAMRQALRGKQVRLGPVLVFMPVLNKPAAVRLRALLWALWHEKSLPAEVPPDGMVSLKIDAGKADRRFYQAIGYPVYGPRAVRIDMLDRVINAVYENAREGKFRAEHKMAEWLGCSIEDLYAVLEAMGHRKIEEPQEEAAPEAEAVAAAEPQAEAAGEAKASEAKPQLAEFRLKKGKAFSKQGGGKPSAKKEGKKKASQKRGPKGGRRDDRPRVISAGPQVKTADSPFAVLEQLKVKKDASGS